MVFILKLVQSLKQEHEDDISNSARWYLSSLPRMRRSAAQTLHSYFLFRYPQDHPTSPGTTRYHHSLSTSSRYSSPSSPGCIHTIDINSNTFSYGTQCLRHVIRFLKSSLRPSSSIFPSKSTHSGDSCITTALRSFVEFLSSIKKCVFSIVPLDSLSRVHRALSSEDIARPSSVLIVLGIVSVRISQSFGEGESGYTRT